MVEVIRAALADRYDAAVAAAVRVQYGGSVKPSNIREFMAHPEIDGALVGGASLDPEEFALKVAREIATAGVLVAVVVTAALAGTVLTLRLGSLLSWW